MAFTLARPALLGRLLFFAAVLVGVGKVVGGGVAPRSLVRPPLRVSVITGLAAGRNLCSLEYLRERAGQTELDPNGSGYVPRGIDYIELFVLKTGAHLEAKVKENANEENKREPLPGRWRGRVEARV